MRISTYLKLVVLLCCLHSTVPESNTSNCKIGQLDEKYFSECGNRGYVMKCSDPSLTQIPNSYPMPQNFTKYPPPLCLLDLSYNKFYLVGNQSFVNVKNLNSTDVLWLYLDFSNITYIASDAFENLTNLLYLNLTGNYLNQPGSFGDGVFKPLTSLRDIIVKENSLETFDKIGTELQYLKHLQRIHIDLCPDCVFGKTFSKQTNLRTLYLSGKSKKKTCYAPSISNITFRYVSTVEYLYMESCHIESIDKNAFSYFKNITLLDISYNEHLNFAGMNEALYGLKNSPTLKFLDVRRIHLLYGSGIQLKLTDIENLKTLRALETLHMDLNKIEVFDENILNPYQFPDTLRNVTLFGNRLTYGIYTKYLQKAIGIEFLDLSGQHLNFDPFVDEHFETRPMLNNGVNDFSKLTRESNCSSLCNVCLPRSLRKIKWRKSFIYLSIISPIFICGASGLEYLDLSFNLISKWSATVFGVENMTHLDLSENNCDEVEPTFFLMFKSMENLNISGNSLGKAFNPDFNPNASKMFENQKNMKLLDLSFNKINRLPWDFFKYLRNIEDLSLSDNIIVDWNFTLEHSRCLRRLDLSGNKLYQLPESLTTYLDSVVEENCNQNAIVSVRLSSNPIECSCKTLPFLKWLRYSKVDVYFKPEDICRLNGENYQYLSNEHMEQLISILENDVCLDRSWLTWTISVTCSFVLCVLTLIVSCILYKNRWKLRYIYYSRNRRYVHEGFEHLFENDAFVSYSKNSASFMKYEMVPSLETQHGLHLWVADRNSVPGTSVAENICHGIYNSRKSILLINKEYLNDNWCDYEMNMAHMESIETKRKMIIIVLMESVPMESLPICLMRFLHTERSLEYPEHSENVSTFWMNLAQEIMC